MTHKKYSARFILRREKEKKSNDFSKIGHHEQLVISKFYFDVMIDGNKIIKNITYHFCMISRWNLVYFEIQRIWRFLQDLVSVLVILDIKTNSQVYKNKNLRLVYEENNDFHVVRNWEFHSFIRYERKSVNLFLRLLHNVDDIVDHLSIKKRQTQLRKENLTSL